MAWNTPNDQSCRKCAKPRTLGIIFFHVLFMPQTPLCLSLIPLSRRTDLRAYKQVWRKQSSLSARFRQPSKSDAKIFAALGRRIAYCSHGDATLVKERRKMKGCAASDLRKGWMDVLCEVNGIFSMRSCRATVMQFFVILLRVLPMEYRVELLDFTRKIS